MYSKKGLVLTHSTLWVYSQPAARFGAGVGLGSGRFWDVSDCFPG